MTFECPLKNVVCYKWNITKFKKEFKRGEKNTQINE